MEDINVEVVDEEEEAGDEEKSLGEDDCGSEVVILGVSAAEESAGCFVARGDPALLSVAIACQPASNKRICMDIKLKWNSYEATIYTRVYESYIYYRERVDYSCYTC